MYIFHLSPSLGVIKLSTTPARSQFSPIPSPAHTPPLLFSMATGGLDTAGLITVHIKTPKNKETVQTAPNATVKSFKALVSEKFSAPADKICLIFSGKILKDEETLDKLDIRDGLTVRRDWDTLLPVLCVLACI